MMMRPGPRPPANFGPPWLRLAVAAALLFGGCGKHGGGEKGGDEEETPAPLVQVHTVPLTHRSFVDQILAPGEWRSSDEIVISAPFAGTVLELKPRLGDRVAAGSTITWMETAESRAAMRGAQLLLHQARDATGRAEARRAMALASRQRVRVPITAPRSGVVLRRTAAPGSYLAENAEVMALVPAGAIVFEARVPASEAGRVRVGQMATIRMLGLPSWNARVQRILPTAGESDQATLAWLAPLGARAPAMERFGEATISVSDVRQSPAVPDSSIVEDDVTAVKRVAVVRGGRANWIKIRPGASSDGWTEVRAPSLADGLPVIVPGQRGLPDSARVQVER